MATFNAFVHLADEDGNVIVFQPGQRAPEWAVKKAGKHCFTKVEDANTVEVNGPGQTSVDAERQKAAFEAYKAARAGDEKTRAQADAEEAAAKAEAAKKGGGR